MTTGKKSDSRTLTLISTLLVLAGGLALYLAWEIDRTAHALDNPLLTTGTIEKAMVTPSLATIRSRLSFRSGYRAEVTYRYRVGDKDFVGEFLFSGRENFSENRTEVETWLKECCLPIGKEIPVSYSAKTPEVSALKVYPATSPAPLFLAVGGALVSLLGVLLLIMGALAAREKTPTLSKVVPQPFKAEFLKKIDSALTSISAVQEELRKQTALDTGLLSTLEGLQKSLGELKTTVLEDKPVNFALSLGLHRALENADFQSVDPVVRGKFDSNLSAITHYYDRLPENLEALSLKATG